MSFQVRFEGPVSADLTDMLRAVERQVNWQGVRAQGPDDTAPSAASGVASNGTIITHPHPHPHPTVLDLVIVAVVALIVGFIVGRSSVTRTVPR